MILTVTLNAAIDRTVAVPNFHLGYRHRAVEARTMAGGKGVNIARALRLLGRPVIATNLGGPSETVEDGVTGWLTRPGDVSDLAWALVKALSMDAEARAELGARARASVLRDCNKQASSFRDYTWGDQESDHYRACMAEHGQPE